MIKKLREIYETKVKILDENKNSNVMNVSVPFIQADEKNINGRTYPISLLKREVARVQGSVKKGSFIGTGDHPSSGTEDIATASHIVTALSLDEKGQGTAELRILPTERGKTVQTLIRNNAQLGVSIRGFGTVSKDGRVADDYKLAGLDVVLNPSFKGAVFDKNNISESQNFGEESAKNKDEDKELEKAINKLERESYLSAVDAGFEGDQKSWLRNCGSLREAMGLKEDEEEIRVEKLTEEAINKRIRGYYREAVAGGFRGDFNSWKEQYPRIVEMAKQPIKIAEKKKEKRGFDGRMTLGEARGAGFKGTVEEFKEQYPEMELVLPSAPQKIKKVDERELTEKEITEESARIFTTLSKDNPNNTIMLEDVKNLLMEEEEEKVDKRIRKKAIMIISREADGSCSQEKLKEMVEIEIKNLKEERKKRLEANWECYKRLLD